MQSYYEVDPQWEVFEIHSQEQYLTRYLVEGYFHTAVPKDVQESFFTVSHLTAQAYFYYPLYDEAFNKALRILEMAVKLKATELGFSLKTKKSFDKKLDDLIKEICALDGYAVLNHSLDRARRIRNSQMHSHTNSFIGATNHAPDNIKLIVNTINGLFQSPDWHVKRHAERKAIEDQISKFPALPFYLEKGKPLLNSVIGVEVYEQHLFLLAEPILLNLTEALKEHRAFNPLQFQLKDYTITKDGIEGINEKGERVSLTQSSHPTNVEIFENYQHELSELSMEDEEMHTFLILSACDWLPVVWEYEIHKNTLATIPENK